MALPSILSDPNFIYLTRLLKTNPRDALSYLDHAWLLMNISGDPTYADADHLEALLYWEGKPGHLTKCLLQTGFITKGKKDTYILAEWESHLYDWGRKRLRRKEEAANEAAAARPPKSAKVRPTDPDTDSSSLKGKIISFDPDHSQGKDRNRPKTAKPTRGATQKNPQEAALELVRAANGAIQGLDPPRRLPKAPPPTQPIGSYSARECAYAAASLDKDHDPNTATALWTTRIAEISQYSGGLDYVRDLLAAIQNAHIAGNPKGVGRIYHPGRFLNAKTLDFINERKAQ